MKATIALPRVASRIFGIPLAVTRGKADLIVKAVAPKLLGGELASVWDDDEEEPAEPAEPYRLTPDGMAILPVCGTLVTKASGLDALSGLVSYPALAANFQQALDDPKVRGILLDCDSPGGEVKGMYDCADQLYAARGEKPVCAYGLLACSAAYLQASAADLVMVPQDGEVGSIGIIALHCDESAYDAKIGLKYTAVYAGERKNDGNPHEPLSDGAYAAIKASVDKCNALFVAAVARNRGMKAQALLAMQAAVFMGDDAVNAGLADGVGTKDDALALLRQAVNSGARTITSFAAVAARKEPAMAENNAAAAMTAAELEAKLGEARKAGYAAALQIVDLCAVAGAPAKTAAQFLTDNKSVQEVGTSLLNAKAAAEPRLDPSVHPEGEGAKPGQSSAKPWSTVFSALGIRTKGGK